ncbi:MAG: hypothetical protein GY913_22060 [Proteobacteria bacterium]|nr:hypothetical protein [Pseudomonadota bacterium]MCP4919596.1 hypothetical protein [Pseudomonadota bacterium]
MDRNQLVELLPCFVCGDLPDEVMEQVRVAVAADPELAAIVAALSESNDLCPDALSGSAPGGLLLDAPTPPSTLADPSADEPANRGWPLVVGLACAALLALALLLPNQSADLPHFEEDLVHAAQVSADLHVDRVDGWIPASSSSELKQAFLDGGLTMPMAVVADLEGIGLTVVGGVAHQHGTLVTYEDADGERFDCHMTGVLPTELEPTQVLEPPRDGLPALEVFERHGQTAVLWQDGMMMCVLVTHASADRLVAVAQAKVWGVAG